MEMANPQRALIMLAATQHGYVRPDDARAAGIDPVRLRHMARRGVFSHVSRGLYRARDIPCRQHDDLARAMLWPQGIRGVISHKTAMDLHDLCDLNPADYEITVPSRYRIRHRTPPANYRFHHRDLDPRDVTTVDGIRVVTPVRAILDGIETGVRDSLIYQAVETLRLRREILPGEESRIFAALEGRRHD